MKVEQEFLVYKKHGLLRALIDQTYQKESGQILVNYDSYSLEQLEPEYCQQASSLSQII